MALQLPLPARAQAPTGTLKLASQTPWVGPGQELSMRVEATSAAPAASLELAVSVFRQVTSRSEFLLTLQDRIRGSALSTTAVPLNELAADPAGALTIRLPIQDPALPPDRARIRLRDEGVYPVRVELREAGGGRALDRLTTHLVYATPPTEGGLPLGFSWVLPVSAPPSLQPQGPRAVDQAASDRLALLAQRLDAHPDVPVTLQPTPETLEGLAASNREVDRNTVQTLADMAKTRQVVAGPYVPVVPGAFNGGGGESEFAAQLDRGADVLSTVLSVRADPRTWVAEDRIDEAGLERLRTQQVDRVVLPEAALAPANLSVTLTQPFDLQSRSLRRPAAAAADTELGNHFTQGDDPVLRAHVLLADLAVIYFDRPGKPRGVVAVTPRTWAPDAAFLDAVLAGLASSPIVKGVSLDDLFDDVPKATGARNSPLIRPLAANPAPASLPLAAIRAARGRLEAFATMLDADNRLTDDLEKVLLASESADLRTRQRTQYIEGVDGRVSAETGRLQVPASRTITLTARRGDIPVTVQWTGDYPVRVQVHVASDKLTFPGGSDTRIVELTRRNTTERFVVQARTSGAFPLRITLQSPDGNLVLGRARYTVRSTAASGVGIGLSIGAGAVLVLWWARNLAKGRRNRRLVPA
jgi:hypothetical protein